MPGFSPPPVLVNTDPTKVGYEFLGAAPAAVGAPGIVAERVGHVHALGRTIRQTTGMGLYQDIQATSDNCNAYLTTNVGALPALGVWTFETWFWGGNGVIGGGQIGWFLGFFTQGGAVSTPNPDGGGQIPLIGFKNQGGGGGGAELICHDGSVIVMTGTTSVWNHFAVVWDGAAYHAYRGGVLVGSHTPSSAPALAALLLGLGAWQTGTFTGRIRVAQTRLSSIPRYTAPFTPALVPFVPDSTTAALWNYSDVPLGQWGVFYQSPGGSSPAPGGQPLAAGWHWTPSATFDASGNGRDLGIALNLSTNIGDHGSCIYSAGVAGITAQDAVVASPAVTSLQAMTGDVQLQDSTGAALAPAPGNPGVVKLPVIPALDATAADIQPVAGTAAAGAVGKAADAGHQHVGVHSITAGTNVSLSGTATDPVISASGGGGGGGTGNASGALLARTAYNPGTIATYTRTAATFADIDTGNLAATFKAPASGRVVVVLSAVCKTDGVAVQFWTVAGAGTAEQVWAAAESGAERHNDRLLVTGLTPGASTTLTWQWASDTAGHTVTLDAGGPFGGGGGVGPAIFEVYDGTLGGTQAAGNALLGITDYDPGSITTMTPGASLAAVDSTNLTVSFVAPPSGNVMVLLTGSPRASNNASGDWQGWGVVTHGTTTLVSALVNALQQVNQSGGGVAAEPNITVRLYVTGLTPGATVQLDWAYQTSGTGATQTTLLLGNNGTLHMPAMIEVYDATLGGAFPGLGDLSWIPPTFANSWVNAGGSHANVGFRKDALGFVHFRGWMSSGTLGATAFTLPAGYRPGAEFRQFVEGANSGNTAAIGVEITLSTAGALSVSNSAGNGNGWLSLDGVSFLAEN